MLVFLGLGRTGAYIAFSADRGKKHRGLAVASGDGYDSNKARDCRLPIRVSVDDLIGSFSKTDRLERLEAL